MMISHHYDIKEFVAAVKNKEYSEIITLADHEATLAERCGYRKSGRPAEAAVCLKYANQLKDLISYLRYSTKPTGRSFGSVNLFRELIDTESEIKYRASFRSAGGSLFYSPVRSTAIQAFHS